LGDKGEFITKLQITAAEVHSLIRNYGFILLKVWRSIK